VKISNETKVGALAVIAVTFLILGFNFLKGKKIWSDSKTIYGVYHNVQGLSASNPVIINGLQVGTVYKLSNDKDMRRIVVSFNITKDINIPANSIALIKPNPITTTSVEIKLGNASAYLKNNDTIYTEANAGLFEDILRKVDPVLYEVKRAVTSLDTLIKSMSAIFDPAAKSNIQATLGNLHKISASMVVSSASLQSLLNAETGTLAKTMDNINSVTSNLEKNNEKISNVFSNLDTATTKFARLDLEKTLSGIDTTINNLKLAVSKFNDDTGTIGMLLNDTKLYTNLASTSNKLNVLLDDIRLHPKRYFSLSLIGGKSKGSPLMQPLPDTVNSPYIIKKATDP
jgi:phospholipid/cholesterol/gamma-HCH transport system substrate-binding protein